MEKSRLPEGSVFQAMLQMPGKGAALALNTFSNRRAKHLLNRRIAATTFASCGRLVVYTAIFGGKDRLMEAPRFPKVDFVCFTDDSGLTSRTWKIVSARPEGDPRRAAKIYKIVPHRFFPDYDQSLWVDGTHVPDIDPRYLAQKYLRNADIAMYAHHSRNCIYEEMQACRLYGKGDPEAINRQEAAYLSEGYPAQNGLATCTVILRNHNLSHVKRVMEDWWTEISSYSIRDQLSFNYVAHRNRLTYTVIPGNVYRNHFFRAKEHRQPDKCDLSIGWALNGTEETASARIMGYNMHAYFSSLGIRSKILFRPDVRYCSSLNADTERIDEWLRHNINLLVIVKLEMGRTLDYLILRCRELGIKIVYAVCDLPLCDKLMEKADAILAPSDELGRFVPAENRHKVSVVFDGYEQDSSLRKVHHANRGLKLCLVTNKVWDRVPCLTGLPENVSLKIIGPNAEIRVALFPDSKVFRDSPFAVEYVEWNADTVLDEILECDAGIIPWPEIDKQVRVKSANRLVLFMSLGMPVVASPVPSFLEIVRQGENGFIARAAAEWQEHIITLRDNPVVRSRIGDGARRDVVPRFSKEKQGEAYREVFSRLLHS